MFPDKQRVSGTHTSSSSGIITKVGTRISKFWNHREYRRRGFPILTGSQTLLGLPGPFDTRFRSNQSTINPKYIESMRGPHFYRPLARRDQIICLEICSLTREKPLRGTSTAEKGFRHIPEHSRVKLDTLLDINHICIYN